MFIIINIANLVFSIMDSAVQEYKSDNFIYYTF